VTSALGAQGTVRCFDGEVSPARLQYISHPAFPASQSSAWQPAQKRDSTLQYGPRQSALCAAGQTGSLVKQTVKPDQGQVCCNSGADCERKAGDYTFFDTTCAQLGYGVMLPGTCLEARLPAWSMPPHGTHPHSQRTERMHL